MVLGAACVRWLLSIASAASVVPVLLSHLQFEVETSILCRNLS